MYPFLTLHLRLLLRMSISMLLSRRHWGNDKNEASSVERKRKRAEAAALTTSPKETAALHDGSVGGVTITGRRDAKGATDESGVQQVMEDA